MSTHFCGGTILDAKTILSAAHCFPKGAQGTDGKQVMAGSVNVQDTKTSQIIDFGKLVWNTKQPYNENSNNDIIIIKLKSPLKFNDKVQPACLPDVASFVKAQANKQMAVLSGWGGLKDQGDTPNLLQFLPLPIFPNGKCGGMYDGAFGDSMFCAGYAAGGKDPCQGDSGGPLVMPKSSTDDTAVIVGAVSHGMGKCGEKGAPAIYARVTKYLDWIKANMG
jgi:secreted trypsin-like serine protease